MRMHRTDLAFLEGRGKKSIVMAELDPKNETVG
jgi:hypothetical protein